MILYLFDCRMVKSSNEPTEKTRKATKLRAEGRPYKKLAAEVLVARKQDIEKKLSVHAAHSTLLQHRLELYAREQALRKLQEGGDQEATETSLD